MLTVLLQKHYISSQCGKSDRNLKKEFVTDRFPTCVFKFLLNYIPPIKIASIYFYILSFPVQYFRSRIIRD